MIIIPITKPTPKALSEAISKPTKEPRCLINGATVTTAKKPYTTVGIPERISKIGLVVALTLVSAYSDKYIAVNNPIGTANNNAIKEINIVPANNGIAPNKPEDPT